MPEVIPIHTSTASRCLAHSVKSVIIKARCGAMLSLCSGLNTTTISWAITLSEKKYSTALPKKNPTISSSSVHTRMKVFDSGFFPEVTNFRALSDDQPHLEKLLFCWNHRPKELIWSKSSSEGILTA